MARRGWMVAAGAVVLLAGAGCDDASQRCEGLGGQGCGAVVVDPASQVPSGAHLVLDCQPYDVPALTVHDCSFSRYCGERGTIPCTLKLVARDGVVIEAATTAGFAAEAGAISPAATSPALDPALPVAEQQELGHAVGWLEICDAPLPPDVPPISGEHRASFDYGCGPRVANPRDGLVTVIGWVRGEEGYVDVDQDSRHGEGEPFIDQGEPYVDADDDGRWEAGEWWLDVNGNGRFDGPNGTWDADTVIWAQTRVRYSGWPLVVEDGEGNLLASGFYDGVPVPPPPPFQVHVGATVAYPFSFVDPYLNALNGAFTFTAGSAAGNVTVGLFGPYVPITDLGPPFRLLYCDGPDLDLSELDDATVLAHCQDGPAAQGCATSPCYQALDVARCAYGACPGFGEAFGDQGAVYLTGKQVGPDVVTVTATGEGGSVTIAIQGQCVP